MLEILLASARATVSLPDIPGYALFLGGSTGSSAPSDYTDRYTYTDKTVVAGVKLLSQRYRHAAAGNAVVGIVAGGGGAVVTSTTDRYSFASLTFSTGALLTPTRSGLVAAGNTDWALFFGGQSIANITKYTFGADTMTAASSLPAARYNAGATGNSTTALVGGGNSGGNVATTVLCAYAPQVITGGTALLRASPGVLAISDEVHALIGGGNSGLNFLDSYTYATNVVAAATNISVAVYAGGATGNAEMGILGGGGATNSNTVECLYANDSRAAGTALGQARVQLAAISSALHF